MRTKLLQCEAQAHISLPRSKSDGKRSKEAKVNYFVRRLQIAFNRIFQKLQLSSSTNNSTSFISKCLISPPCPLTGMRRSNFKFAIISASRFHSQCFCSFMRRAQIFLLSFLQLQANEKNEKKYQSSHAIKLLTKLI
jgi:hypothetical protein